MAIGDVLSGVLCILLEKHNFSQLDDGLKIPIYMLLGASMAFIVIYTVFDLVEMVNTSVHYYVLSRGDYSYKPAILSNMLYLAMIIKACIMGGSLGIVYGVIDVERYITYGVIKVYRETFAEIIYALPIGLFIGVVFGILFGVLRALELHHMPE